MKNSKQQSPGLGNMAFKGNPVDTRKPAKMNGSQSGTGPRKQSTKND